MTRATTVDDRYVITADRLLNGLIAFIRRGLPCLPMKSAVVAGAKFARTAPDHVDGRRILDDHSPMRIFTVARDFIAHSSDGMLPPSGSRYCV